MNRFVFTDETGCGLVCEHYGSPPHDRHMASKYAMHNA
jgi:hypothetical protein